MSRRYWVWTVNNYIGIPIFNPKYMDYLGWAPQVGESGTPHLQGYVQFSKPRVLSRVVSALKDAGPAHVEPARGTGQQARDYYAVDEKGTNTGPVEEFGTLDPAAVNAVAKANQGVRNDLKAVEKALREGQAISLVRAEWPDIWAKYQHWVNWIISDMDRGERKDPVYPIVLPWCSIPKPDPAEKKRHWWIWGPPDVGKTNITQTAMAGMKVYSAGPNAKYRFESYEHEDIVLFDDCVPTLQEILDATNTWHIQRERVGGKRYSSGYWKVGHSRTLVILANHAPKDWPASFHARFNVLYVGPSVGAAAPPAPPASPGGAWDLGAQVLLAAAR